MLPLILMVLRPLFNVMDQITPLPSLQNYCSPHTNQNTNQLQHHQNQNPPLSVTMSPYGPTSMASYQPIHAASLPHRYYRKSPTTKPWNWHTLAPKSYTPKPCNPPSQPHHRSPFISATHSTPATAGPASSHPAPHTRTETSVSVDSVPSNTWPSSTWRGRVSSGCPVLPNECLVPSRPRVSMSSSFLRPLQNTVSPSVLSNSRRSQLKPQSKKNFIKNSKITASIKSISKPPVRLLLPSVTACLPQPASPAASFRHWVTPKLMSWPSPRAVRNEISVPSS
mmetsp:Transcript_3797/g.5605  ORF Transcript_3797/g.5605 Transcript_3797/m.5605 type:complete len:281 (-) Transcript_3797:1583-2425(-)